MTSSADKAGPLAGVRVVDASTFISGPLAAAMLADLGATVIKVEADGRDRLNRWGRTVAGRGLVYSNCNRGKDLVHLDLKSDDGRAHFSQVAAAADVVLTNWRVGVAERLGVVDILDACPSVVWVKITGWGPDGPLAAQPAFDASVQARSGLAWVQGDAEPRLVRTFIADKVTAMFAVQAVVSALFERTVTGHGTVIDLSMLDAMAYFNFADVMQNRTALTDAPTGARNEQTEANRPMRTADGWVVLSPVGGKQLKATLVAVDRLDAIDHLRDAPTQHELTRRLVEVCAGPLSQKPTADWLSIFGQADVPCAPVLDIDAHLVDPQVLHNEIYEEIDDPLLGRVRRARYPARLR